MENALVCVNILPSQTEEFATADPRLHHQHDCQPMGMRFGEAIDDVVLLLIIGVLFRRCDLGQTDG